MHEPPSHNQLISIQRPQRLTGRLKLIGGRIAQATQFYHGVRNPKTIGMASVQNKLPHARQLVRARHSAALPDRADGRIVIAAFLVLAVRGRDVPDVCVKGVLLFVDFELGCVDDD